MGPLEQGYGYWEKDQRHKVPLSSFHISGYILPMWPATVGVKFDHLTQVVFVTFIHYKFIPFPNSIVLSLEWSHLNVCSADTEKLEQLSTKYLHELFGMLCTLLYLVIGTVIYIIITHGYLCYTLDYISIVCYLLCCWNVFPVWAWGTSFLWLLCSFGLFSSLCRCVCFSISLLFVAARCSGSCLHSLLQT